MARYAGPDSCGRGRQTTAIVRSRRGLAPGCVGSVRPYVLPGRRRVVWALSTRRSAMAVEEREVAQAEDADVQEMSADDIDETFVPIPKDSVVGVEIEGEAVL